MYPTRSSSAIEYYRFKSREDDSVEFFEDLWSSSNPAYIENTCLKAGKRFLSRSIALIRGKKRSVASELSSFAGNLWRYNLMYTPNTFKPCGNENSSTRAKNMFAVYAFAIDVDFKKPMQLPGNAAFAKDYQLSRYQFPAKKYYLNYDLETTVYSGSPRFFYDFLSEEFEFLNIPVPSYIETGHQLRMIYLLSDPVSCSSNYFPKAKSLIQAIQQHICDALNGYFGCYAEIQNLNSYFRMPNSKNTKDGSIVRIWKISGKKYDLGQLRDEYLPDLTLPSKEYKTGKKKAEKSPGKNITLAECNTGKITQLHNTFTLCRNRMDVFCELRDYACENNRREVLTFLYVATALTIYPERTSVELAEHFNTGFPNPLKANELRWSLRRTHAYAFRTKTIANMLGLTVQDLEEYGLHANKRKQAWQDKVSRGETRTQRAEAHYAEFCSLQEKGFSRSEIAKMMNMSEESIKGYRKRWRKEQTRETDNLTG